MSCTSCLHIAQWWEFLTKVAFFYALPFLHNSVVQNVELKDNSQTHELQTPSEGINLKISEKLGWYGRQNMLRPYLKIWEWILGRSVKAISSFGVRSPWSNQYTGVSWFCGFIRMRLVEDFYLWGWLLIYNPHNVQKMK